MSLRFGRIAALAASLGAVGAMFVATTPASAIPTVTQQFENWVVTGSLTPKKLNEPVVLPKGSTFNGSATITYTGDYENISGTATGIVAVPSFNASLALLGIVPTNVGVTFQQVGKSEGTITPGELTPECPTHSGVSQCVNMSVLSNVNVGITMLGTNVEEPGVSLGASVTTNCVTSEPIAFHLSTQIKLPILLVWGPAFTGTTTIPPLKCEGPEALLLAPVLSAVMSGPDNSYELAITRPGLNRENEPK